MHQSEVFIVILRRPKTDPDEKRSDPFWEFGSFGITGCHDKNLMNPKKADRLQGARLAFAQGGHLGTRLVFITPPIRVVRHADRIEAIWTPCEMPFRYSDAPRLADNKNMSDFPLFSLLLKDSKRTTPEGSFASSFRSRAKPVAPTIGEELIQIYSQKRSKSPSTAFARQYSDALPSLPPVVDQMRYRTYAELRDSPLVRGYMANVQRNLAIVEGFKFADSEVPNIQAKPKNC